MSPPSLRLNEEDVQLLQREGGEERTLRAVPLSLFAEALTAPPDFLIPLLPFGTRCARFVHRGNVVNARLILEERAAVRSVRWNYRSTRLAFPACVFVIGAHAPSAAMSHWALSYIRVFFRPGPITSLADPLFRAWLPHVNHDGTPCLRTWLEYPQAPTLGNIGHAFREWFWRSGFIDSGDGYDALWLRARMLDRRLKSVEAWAQSTAENPEFLRTYSYEPAGCTVGSILTDLEGPSRPVDRSHLIDLMMQLEAIP